MKSFGLTVVAVAVFQASTVQATGGYDPYLVNYRGYDDHEADQHRYDHHDFSHGHMNQQPKFLSAEEEYQYNSLAARYDELLSLYNEAVEHEHHIDEALALHNHDIHHESTHEELVVDAYNKLESNEAYKEMEAAFQEAWANAYEDAHTNYEDEAMRDHFLVAYQEALEK